MLTFFYQAFIVFNALLIHALPAKFSDWKRLIGCQYLNGCLLIFRVEESMYVQQWGSEGKSLLAA